VKYLLDTSTCIAHLRGRGSPVTARLLKHGADAVLCSVVLMELQYGVRRSKDPVAEQARCDAFTMRLHSLPLDDRGATEAARIRSGLAAVGTPIGPYDLLIAAIALANDLTLVTCNAGEFRRVAGLRVVNWQEA